MSIKTHASLRNGAINALAGLSLLALVCTVYWKGTEFPFGPELSSVTVIDNALAETYDEFEIIYYGNRECRDCQNWKRTDLPKWRRSVLSRRVQLTLRSSDCLGNSSYAQICEQVSPSDTTQPAFVLIQKKTGTIIAMGKGAAGFYKVTQEAEKWADYWQQNRNNA
ncbi:MAG: hypothetical protein ACWA5L_09715 [bacterium]